ncbi:DNA mismatch repair protein MutS, partial [Staphylococcus chromogenes]
SYGIQVAKLAALPEQVIERAQVILEAFEANAKTQTSEPSVNPKHLEVVNDDFETQPPKVQEPKIEQATFDLFESTSEQSEIELEIKQLNLSQMTPIEALVKLSEFQNKL